MMLERRLERLEDFPKEAAAQRLASLRGRLVRQQGLLKEGGLPVLIQVEGWSAAGKGALLSRFIRKLDPRFFSVDSLQTEPDRTEQRYPFWHRYIKLLPAAGQLALWDGGWSGQLVRQYLLGQIDEDTYRQLRQEACQLERQLADNGYLLIKIFLHINEKEQKRRLQKLLANKDTAWRVNDDDCWQNQRYQDFAAAFSSYIEATDRPYAAWHILDGQDKKGAEAMALTILTTAIAQALAKAPVATELPEHKPVVNRLSQVDLNKTLAVSTYKEELAHWQKKLAELHNQLYRTKTPLIVVYEGWDAAGKGGNIRRLSEALDPRGYEVSPIAAPEPDEKNRYYLWRFWTRLPKSGHIAIFDRSWYGRVLVERVENLCTPADWQRAYEEINEFEALLGHWGAILVKFWLHIDADTQLKRFQERQEDPEKQWKITAEDWRNREKWPQYQEAVEEMLMYTNTAKAPWHIIAGNDKRYARIEALRLVYQTVQEKLKREMRP